MLSASIQPFSTKPYFAPGNRSELGGDVDEVLYFTEWNEQ